MSELYDKAITCLKAARFKLNTLPNNYDGIEDNAEINDKKFEQVDELIGKASEYLDKLLQETKS